MDYIEKMLSLYQDINSKLTWKSVVWTVCIGGTTYTVYSFFIKPFLSPLRKIPGPGYNPIFGNVREAMVGEAMQSSVGWVKKYGGIVRFYHLLGRERVLVADPQALKQVLLTDVDSFSRIVAAQRLLVSGIFNVSGDIHKFQRRLMNPFFNHEHIQSYLDIFATKSRQLIEMWRNRRTDEVKIQVDIMRMTLDVIGLAVFGYEFNSLEDPDSKVNAAFRIVTGQQGISFANLIPFFDKLPTRSNREFEKNLALIDSIIYGIIKEKRQLFSNKSGTEAAQRDFLGKLMLAVDTVTGQGFTDRELRDQVLSLLIAGHETTGATMSWLLLLLAQHPDIQDQVRQEVVQHLPGTADITWEQLDKLHYLNAVIKEGQRLYPAAPSFYRKATKDTKLNGYHIPKGTMIAYHVGAMMRNPEIWTDPEVFNPQRFLQDRDIDLYTHLPFITGPHKCLGHQFAKMQMRAVISRLIREFKFEVQQGSKFTRKMRVTLKAYPPVTLLVSKVTL